MNSTTQDYQFQTCIVKDCLEVSENIFKLSVNGRFVGKAGQFFMLRAWEDNPVLSRPISIYNIKENSIEFLFQKKAQGTTILSKLKSGSNIKLLGPLGNGFILKEAIGNIAIVTGGIGIAPMTFFVKQLLEQNKCSKQLKSICFYSGFKDTVFGFDDIKQSINNYNSTNNNSLLTDFIISTEHILDSKQKYSTGFITDYYKAQNHDVVFCCGPELMMNKIVLLTQKAKVKGFVSEEKKMACGLGACLSCSCKTKNGNKRCCKDGPVFDMAEIEI